MDQILKLYDKEDDPTYGIYKISLQEVANALGYTESKGSNGKPYYRILHELTADYLSKIRTIYPLMPIGMILGSTQSYTINMHS